MTGQELIASYVLGELEGGELADFERRLAADPALRAEVDDARGTITQLEALPAHAWPGEEPVAASAVGEAGDGAAARAPIADIGTVGSRPDANVGAAPDRPAGQDTEPAQPERSGTPRRERSHPRRRLTLRPALAAAALVAVFVIGGAAGALIFAGESSSSAPGRTVLVLHPLDAPPTSRADISMPAADTMLLRTHGLPASPAGSYYEVWLMSNERKLVPVASFRVGASGDASVEVPLPASPANYRYFDVSRQRIAGGTGHSTDSVLRGSTSGLS